MNQMTKVLVASLALMACGESGGGGGGGGTPAGGGEGNGGTRQDAQTGGDVTGDAGPGGSTGGNAGGSVGGETGGVPVGGETGGAVGGVEPPPADGGVGGVEPPLPDAGQANCSGTDRFLSPEEVCCEGLARVCPYERAGIACGAPCDFAEVCIACGDGTCDANEDICNCPLDCEGGGPGECVPEGGVLEVGGMALCCMGLLPLPATGPDANDVCDFDAGGLSVCAQANNGQCGIGENFCNAPVDCPPPEVPCSENGQVIDPIAGSCCDPAAFPMQNAQPDVAGNCIFGAAELVCVNSMDGQCGAGESFCNSPVDCPPPAPPCVEQGQPLNPVDPRSACCDGLAPLGCDSPDFDGVCRQSCEGVSYCAACGNGTCEGADVGGAENPCNCPEDCGQVPGCVQPGGNIPAIQNPPSCCPGYGPIGCQAPNNAGMCQPCVGAARCAQCGDGVCTAAEGENPCNCAQDCRVQ